MIESCQELQSQAQPAVELRDNIFFVDALLIAELLHIPPTHVPALMRDGKITSACERGIDEHAGEFRLTFFHGRRRARLSTDQNGRILRRSVIDFGDRTAPAALRRAAR